MVKRNTELENLEIQLLLEGIYQHYGFDFRLCAPASLKRRILHFLEKERVSTISGLQEKILHDPVSMEKLSLALTVNVSAMFRDPSFFVTFRNQVVPLIQTYPLVHIWCAGCSTGEEVYSLAILLEEVGYYERCRIYATDINEAVVRKARDGIFPMAVMQEYTQNYQKAGGSRSFSDYYTAAYDAAMMHPSLKRNIVFAQHNLATDAGFNEFQVILCRNVMIYFTRPLQDRVHNLLYESLCKFGALGLGNRETLKFTPHENDYRSLDGAEKIYQRIR